MEAEKTALILIGYQNDYFEPHGLLHGALETSERVREVHDRTLGLLEDLAPTATTIISTPILFTDGYTELVNPIGILRVIKDVGAFRRHTRGGETIAGLRAFGDRILEVPGKRGLNAFSNTDLESVLQQRGIQNVVIAGVVTSICVDSTGRAAAERGYDVTILSDCTAGRTAYEQEFYVREVFPLYARVTDTGSFARELTGWTVETAATT